jgi:hypothetical protein
VDVTKLDENEKKAYNVSFGWTWTWRIEMEMEIDYRKIPPFPKYLSP